MIIRTVSNGEKTKKCAMSIAGLRNDTSGACNEAKLNTSMSTERFDQKFCELSGTTYVPGPPVKSFWDSYCAGDLTDVDAFQRRYRWGTEVIGLLPGKLGPAVAAILAGLNPEACQGPGIIAETLSKISGEISQHLSRLGLPKCFLTVLMAAIGDSRSGNSSLLPDALKNCVEKMILENLPAGVPCQADIIALGVAPQ